MYCLAPVLYLPSKQRVIIADFVERRYKEGNLSVGENSCLDRCCAKYWQASIAL